VTVNHLVDRCMGTIQLPYNAAVLCLQSKLQNHGPVQSKSQDDSLLPLTIPKVTSSLKLFAHFIDEILIVANIRT